MIRLTADEIRHIGLFESLTGTEVKDCVIDESGELVTFLVKERQLGKAIGRNGNRIRRIQRILGKNIEVVEFSDNPEQFVRNVLAPAKPDRVEIVERSEGRVAVVYIDFHNRKLAIGKKGRKIQNAKKLAFRHHKISNIVFR
jgi:N utilization substance protein A